MSFRVLLPDDPEWMRLVNNLPENVRDIHFLPNYGKIYDDVYGFKPRLAIWQQGDNYIIQPFVLKPLNGLPFMSGHSHNTLYDFSHPYGYGGAIANSEESASHYKDFYAAFHDYCAGQNYPAEFCSLHPLLGDWQKPMIEQLHTLNFQKNVLSVPLNDNLMERFSQGHRRNYRKAIKAGVEIKKVPMTPETFAQFQEIYLYTMQRRNAAARWHFPDDYFPACHRHLGEEETSLFFAYYQGKLASACFLIHGFQTAYYHFGGSYEEFHETRASNLLLTSAMEWANSAGYRHFHLGGGVSSADDDPLAQFKRGFGAMAYPLYNYEKIHDEGMYNTLAKLKIDHEQKANETLVNPAYFPIYRR